MIGFVFSYLLAALGIACGWFNPFIGLMVYCALGILKPPYLWFWAFDQYNHPRFSLYVGLSTLVGLVFKGFGDWSVYRHVKWPLIGLFIFLLTGILTTELCSINRAVAWQWLDARLKIGLMAYITLLLVVNAKQIRTYAWVIVASMGFLAFTLNEWYQMGAVRKFVEFGFATVDNNGVAMTMVMAVPLSFFMGIYDRRLWVKGLCFFAMLMEIHVILFSYSRGGQLGLILVGTTIFVVSMVSLPRKGLTLIVAALFLAVTLHLAGDAVRARFMTIFVDDSQRDASAASRYDTWNAAWMCLKDHPFGVGPRNFNIIADRYGLVNGKSVHNLFLQVGADHGLLGAFGLGLFYFGTMWQTFWAARTPTARHHQWPAFLGNTVCISLAGFLLCSQFIGMEAVELSYMIAMLGLCTVGFVKQAEASHTARDGTMLPELEQVPGFGLPKDILTA